MAKIQAIDFDELHSFLERKAEELFIVDQFFRDLNEVGLESAVLRVRAYERINLYERGTYEDLCSFVDIQAESGYADTPGIEPEQQEAPVEVPEGDKNTYEELAPSEDLLVRGRGKRKVRL